MFSEAASPEARNVDTSLSGLSLTDEARTQATISTVLVTIGGAALAGGLVLFAIAPRAHTTAGKVRALPYASASSGGVSLNAAW